MQEKYSIFKCFQRKLGKPIYIYIIYIGIYIGFWVSSLWIEKIFSAKTGIYDFVSTLVYSSTEFYLSSIKVCGSQINQTSDFQLAT